MRLTQICGEVIYGGQNTFLTEVVQSSSLDAERIHLQKQLVFCLQKASVANMLSQIGDFDTTVALNVLKIIAEGALNLNVSVIFLHTRKVENMQIAFQTKSFF